MMIGRGEGREREQEKGREEERRERGLWNGSKGRQVEGREG